MNLKTKLIIITLLTIIPILFHSNFTMANINFNENDIVLRFSLMADTHLKTQNALNTNKTQNALQYLKNMNLDSIIFNGDITDYGFKSEINLFNSILEKSNINFEKTKLLITLGNHEAYNHELCGNTPTTLKSFKNILGNKLYVSDSQLKSSYYHTTINGYHFIMFYCDKYTNGVSFTPESIEWLKQTLHQASIESPNKPIFFAMHPLIKDTILSSDSGAYWATTDNSVYDILSQYPQIIAFGSHLHSSIQDERCIHQKDFTSVQTGAVSYNSLGLYDKNKNTNEIMFISNMKNGQPLDSTLSSQGLLVEVDRNNNTKISRLNFSDNNIIKQPWIIPTPNSKTHLQYYTYESRTKNNLAPTFSSDCKVGYTINNTDYYPKLNISFNTATDDDMVRNYDIRFVEKETKNIIKKIYLYSDFYLHSNIENMSKIIYLTGNKHIMYPMKYNYPKDYYIEVFAIDSYGLISKPIRSEIIPGNPTGNNENLEVLTIPNNNWKFKSFHPNNNYDGALEVWTFVDFTNQKFDYCYFTITNNGLKYSTSVPYTVSKTYYYIQDENRNWVKKEFSSNGKIHLDNYKGFIRFETESFYNQETNSYLIPNNIKDFTFSHSNNNFQCLGFAGPTVLNANSTINNLLSLYKFIDVPIDYWAYDIINIMTEKEIISGFEDGTFKPNNNVTKEQFAKLLVKTLNLTDSSNTNFHDVEAERWSRKYILIASKYLSSDNKDGKLLFLPESSITREEVAIAIVKAKGLENTTPNYNILNKFSDKNDISKNAKKYIAIAVENKLMIGTGVKFNPKSSLTRAEIAKLMNNIC